MLLVTVYRVPVKCIVRQNSNLLSVSYSLCPIHLMFRCHCVIESVAESESSNPTRLEPQLPRAHHMCPVYEPDGGPPG